MAVPQPNYQGIYVRNFLTIFVSLSLLAYVHYQLGQATSNIDLTNAIVSSIINNQTYTIKNERLLQLKDSLHHKPYSSLSQAQCLVRIYLDVLANLKFMAQTLQKTDESNNLPSDKTQLTFSELKFPNGKHDLQGFKSCSDILTMMNFLNPQKTNFIYSNFMQQKYGSFSKGQENEEEEKSHRQKQENKFCLVSYQTNTSKHKLRENLNSLTQQSYQNYNLIVLDNGSTDGSYEIAKVILSDLKEKLISENKKKQKEITKKYQIIHQKNKSGLWQLFRKHDSHCQGADYLIFIDGRDQLSTVHALNIINKKILNQKQKPALITAPILKKKQLSRQCPASLQSIKNNQKIPSYTFKVLSLSLYSSIKQQMFEETKDMTHLFEIERAFTKRSIDFCVENKKPILEIDEMLYVYDTIENKEIDRNEYFIGTKSKNPQKNQLNQKVSQ